MNFLLATISALLFHAVALIPAGAAVWAADNLENALLINVLLGVFNLLPIPPLDGGRIMVGLLPGPLSRAFAALEPYGMMLVIAALLVLPVLGARLGVDLNVVWRSVARITAVIMDEILRATGAASGA